MSMSKWRIDTWAEEVVRGVSTLVSLSPDQWRVEENANGTYDTSAEATDALVDLLRHELANQARLEKKAAAAKQRLVAASFRAQSAERARQEGGAK